MEALFKKGDIVKTKAHGYGVVVCAEKGMTDINVTVSLVESRRRAKYLQSYIEKVDDVSTLPEDIQEVLKTAIIEKISKPNPPGYSWYPPDPPPIPAHVYMEVCMNYFKNWQQRNENGAVGFRHPEYIKHERTYRTECVKLFKADLGAQTFEKLLAEGRYGEIVDRALAVYRPRKNAEGVGCHFNYTNDRYGQISRYRKAIQKCGEETWARLLYAVLYDENLSVTFDSFANYHDNKDFADAGGRWTFTTIYLQLRNIHDYLCVKPGFLKVAASCLGFEAITGKSLPGEALPSWIGYQQYMDFAEWVKQLLLKWQEPEYALPADGDMLDVQTFCYIVHQEFNREKEIMKD